MTTRKHTNTLPEWYIEPIFHSGGYVCTAWLPNGQLLSRAYYDYTEEEVRDMFIQVLQDLDADTAHN